MGRWFLGAIVIKISLGFCGKILPCRLCSENLSLLPEPFDSFSHVYKGKRLQKRLALRCFHHYYSNGSLIFHSQSLFLVSFFPCCFLFFFCFTAKCMALMPCVSLALV
ncbi:hypothetical protein ECC33_08010 [Helicobacter pylori]|nr:hypothetical protein ECC33_08010 [Helicobacter pylori]